MNRLKTIDRILIFTLMLGIFFNLTYQTTLVKGNSMLGTFENNDYLIAKKNKSKNIDKFQRGDVILASVGEKVYIKRIVGLPNETISISKDRVNINEKELEEKYLDRDWNYEMEEIKIPNESFFVMGDNRDNSSDSRNLGDIPIDKVLAKVQLRVYPFNKIKMF